MISNEFIEALYDILKDYTFDYIVGFKEENKTELIVSTLYSCHNMIGSVQVGRKMIIDKDNVEIHFNDTDTDNETIIKIQQKLNDLGVELIFKDGRGLIVQDNEVVYELPMISEKRNNHTIYHISF